MGHTRPHTATHERDTMSEAKKTPRYPLIAVAVKVRPTIEARFLDWMLFVATEAPVGDKLACPIAPVKTTRTGEYSDGTVHTQYDTARRKYIGQFPMLANIDFGRFDGQTLIWRVK